MLGRNDFAFKGLQDKYGWQTVNPHGQMEYDDSTFRKLQNDVNEYLKEFMWSHTVNQQPFARHFEPVKSGLHRWVEAHARILSYVSEKLDDLLNSISDDDNFISRFVRMVYADSGAKGALNIDKEEVRHVMHDLITGGFETTSTSIRWTLVYLANHQDVQQKLHDEIARVVGTETPVTLAHKRDLHYMQAVV